MVQKGKKIHARVRALHANREQAPVLCGYSAGRPADLASGNDQTASQLLPFSQ